MHLDDFAYNVGQRIIPNYAIVCDETVRGSVLLKSNRTTTVAFDRLILPRAIYEESLRRKVVKVSISVQDSRIRTETHQTEPHIRFYQNPDSIHRTNNIPNSSRVSHWFICSRRIDLCFWT